MIIHSVAQGSEEWLDLRKKFLCASDSPALMGCEPYKGNPSQFILDRGKFAEENARPIIEQNIADELYPVVGSIILDGVPLLASFDGITIDGRLIWEHKLWNKKVAPMLEESLPVRYVWQLEHQLLVSGADRALFTMSDGTEEKMVSVYYSSDAVCRALLIDALKNEWDEVMK